MLSISVLRIYNYFMEFKVLKASTSPIWFGYAYPDGSLETSCVPVVQLTIHMGYSMLPNTKC